MIPLRWSMATGPAVMVGGVFIAVTAASLLWEVDVLGRPLIKGEFSTRIFNTPVNCFIFCVLFLWTFSLTEILYGLSKLALKGSSLLLNCWTETAVCFRSIRRRRTKAHEAAQSKGLELSYWLSKSDSFDNDQVQYGVFLTSHKSEKRFVLVSKEYDLKNVSKACRRFDHFRMGPITIEMIRKRSEHNDGVLETLEELVLQEEGIDKIEILGRLCPNLKILYMPNNLIPKLENMHRLKALEYLNLAINNIMKFDGLEGCEMLSKLDMTLNFVDKEGLLTISKLRANIHLKELFLSGNPCTDYYGYRKYVITVVPSLKHLDAHKIKPSERIAAQQEFNALHVELLEACNTPYGKNVDKLEQKPPQRNEKGEEIHEYTIANRVKEHNEMQRLREEQEKKSKHKSEEPKSKRRTGFDPLPTEGRIYQKNEGSFNFKLAESDCGQHVLCDVAVGRYLDTSMIDVDVQPSWLRILIKGKILQLRLPCEVKIDESFVQRSTTTGSLLVTMPKVHPDSKLSDLFSATLAVPHIKSKTNQIPSTCKRSAESIIEPSKTVNFHHIVPNASMDAQPKYELWRATQLSKPLQASISECDPIVMNQDQKKDYQTTTYWENDVPPLE